MVLHVGSQLWHFSEANCEQLMRALHIPSQAVPTDLDHAPNRVAQVYSNLFHWLDNKPRACMQTALCAAMCILRCVEYC